MLKEYYNGYRFSKENSLVYNPFSILYCLDKSKIENYWFSSGTPTFLVELLKDRIDIAEQITTLKKDFLKITELVAFSPKSLPIKTLLFQTGYLTIIGYDEERHEYIVGYPNKEVEESLRQYLVLAFVDINAEDVHSLSRRIRDSLYEQNSANFVATLQVLFASITYYQHIPDERYYHTLLHLILTLSGLRPESEVPTSHGRIDMVLHTPKTIYILEFKYNNSTKRALSQKEHCLKLKKSAIKKDMRLIKNRSQ